MAVGGGESRRSDLSGSDNGERWAALMFRAHYQDGALVPHKPGAGIDPKPAAANDGTIINVCFFVLFLSLSFGIDSFFVSSVVFISHSTTIPLLMTYRQKTCFTICHFVKELSNPLRTSTIGFWT